MHPMTPIKVIRSLGVRVPVPCERPHLYSIDGGKTWMQYSEYYRWKESLVKEMWK